MKTYWSIVFAIGLMLSALAAPAAAQDEVAWEPPEGYWSEDALNDFPMEGKPEVAAAVEDISTERIREYITRLVSFGTRHTLSDTVSDTRGIGAARRYIYSTFQEFSRECGGCLEVSYDRHIVTIEWFPGSPTVPVVNVLAKLPGRNDPNRVIVVTAHYDSRTTDITDVHADAPGANDDASGTAAVMELARVFSQHFPQGLDATVIFAPVAGEEEGLYGSTGLAEDLSADTTITITAAITNDVIGNIHSAEGAVDSTHVQLFSGPPDNGPTRQLARYVEAAAETYVPGLEVVIVERLDRIGRGGDHIPFWVRGYPAVRFTEFYENYLHQHGPNDLLKFVNFSYVQDVARINAATIAELAMAPERPRGLEMERLVGGAPDRGGMDWRLTWEPVEAPDLAGYEITVRKTTESFPSRVIPVGEVTSYVLEDMQADRLWIGVRAVDEEGHRSLIRSFHDFPQLPPAFTEDE